MSPTRTNSADAGRRWHNRIFYGWWIVAAGFVLQMCVSGLLLHAYGAYLVLLEREFGWSRTTLSAGYSIMRGEIGLLGPIEGWLIDKFGPRTVMRFGISCFGVGMVAFSQVASLLAFFAALFLLALGAAMSGFLPLTVSIVNWFQRNRGAALGVMLSGFAAGSLLLPLVAWSLDSFGWRTTALISGMIVISIGFPLTFLIRHRPEDYGLLPDGDHVAHHPETSPIAAQRQTVTYPSTDFGVRLALKTPAFWYLSLGHGAALMVVSGATVHFIAHGTEAGGLSLSGAAMIVALMSMVHVLTQLVGGWIGDRLNKRLLVVTCMLGHALAMVLLAASTASWVWIAFAIINGAAWGVRGPLMTAIRADYFGRAHFGTILGFSTMFAATGHILGPVITGLLYDVTNGYQWSFALLALVALLGAFAFYFAHDPNKTSRVAHVGSYAGN